MGEDSRLWLSTGTSTGTGGFLGVFDNVFDFRHSSSMSVLSGAWEAT